MPMAATKFDQVLSTSAFLLRDDVSAAIVSHTAAGSISYEHCEATYYDAALAFARLHDLALRARGAEPAIFLPVALSPQEASKRYLNSVSMLLVQIALADPQSRSGLLRDLIKAVTGLKSTEGLAPVLLGLAEPTNGLPSSEIEEAFGKWSSLGWSDHPAGPQPVVSYICSDLTVREIRAEKLSTATYGGGPLQSYLAKEATLSATNRKCVAVVALAGALTGAVAGGLASGGAGVVPGAGLGLAAGKVAGEGFCPNAPAHTGGEHDTHSGGSGSASSGSTTSDDSDDNDDDDSGTGPEPPDVDDDGDGCVRPDYDDLMKTDPYSRYGDGRLVSALASGPGLAAYVGKDLRGRYRVIGYPGALNSAALRPGSTLLPSALPSALPKQWSDRPQVASGGIAGTVKKNRGFAAIRPLPKDHDTGIQIGDTPASSTVDDAASQSLDPNAEDPSTSTVDDHVLVTGRPGSLAALLLPPGGEWMTPEQAYRFMVTLQKMAPYYPQVVDPAPSAWSGYTNR